MRVLVFLPSAAIGGAERMTFTLVNHLRRAGGEPLLVLGQGGPLRREVSADVPVVELGVTRMRYAVVRLARLIRRWQPDVVFAAKPNASIALTGAWWLSGRRAALVLRESNFRSAEPSGAPQLFSALLGWCYRRAAKVVAPSEAVAQDLQDRYGLLPECLRVIYNPVDVARIQRLGNGKTRNGAEGPVHLVASGRLIRQKGFDLLLQAMTILRRRDVRLTIIGDGPEREALTTLAASLGLAEQVTLPGFLAEPFHVLSRADLFVLSSRWEGFPNALVEAMACGLPVVATRCRSGPEEILTHGKDGLLCESDSPQALAEQLNRLVDDRAFAAQLGCAARVSAARFDASRTVEAYASLFRDVERGG